MFGTLWTQEQGEERVEKGIIFPILTNLTPTVESCTMKVLEEVGELMQLIGREQRKSGEKVGFVGRKRDWVIATISEAIDTAQASITMAQTLCEEHNINLNVIMEEHERKLRERGYLK